MNDVWEDLKDIGVCVLLALAIIALSIVIVAILGGIVFVMSEVLT